MTYREVDGDSTTASPQMANSDLAKAPENIELYHSGRRIAAFCLAFDCPGKLS
jgi:hypothetical protein